jgi:hypothetical protein
MILIGVMIAALVGFRSNLKSFLTLLFGKISRIIFKCMKKCSDSKIHCEEERDLISVDKKRLSKQKTINEKEISKEILNKSIDSSDFDSILGRGIHKIDDLDHISSKILKINNLNCS